MSSRAVRETRTIEIDVVRRGRAPSSLGIFIQDGELDDGTVGVLIHGFDPNGLAFRDGRLLTRDRLISANGRSLTGM